MIMPGPVPGIRVFAASTKTSQPEKLRATGLLSHNRKLKQQVALDEGKIVIRYQRENCLTTGGTVHGNSFHIIDLMPEIGLDHRMAIDHGTFPEGSQRHPADAHRNAAHRRIAALQHQKIGWKEHAVTDFEIPGTLDAEAGDLVAAKHKSPQIAGAVETALGYCNQVPGQ